MKYIDAKKLRFEVERVKETGCESPILVCDDILSFIDYLEDEQPDVDLEKELDQWRHEHFAGKRDGHYSGEYLERSSQLDLARHFYELRLKVRKEE